MSITRRGFVLGCTAAAACALWPTTTVAGDRSRVSGPYVHGNLAVYVVHGASAPGRRLLTLERALAEKKVVVRETGTVSQLTIENVSDSAVYVQAGEIVRGGKQDRVLGTDLLLPPRSGRVPLPSHCVEQGRWQPRSGEAADRFSTSQRALAHKNLKIANYAGSQSDVWRNVTKVQDGLASNLGADVRSTRSPSSLELTLEDSRLASRAADYVRALEPLLRSHPDAVGFAFAINGEVNSADVYASPRLFAALWPKLLRASANEALVEARPGKFAPPPSLQAVETFLAATEEGTLTTKAPNAHTRTLARDTATRLVVETRDAKAGAGYVHRSYVKK